MSSGSGPRSWSRSRVGPSSGESCRLAPASTRPSGMPWPSTSTERLRPCLRRSTGGRAGALPAAGGVGDAPVDSDVVERLSDDAVVVVAGDAGQPGEQPEADPFVEVGPQGAGRAR